MPSVVIVDGIPYLAAPRVRESAIGIGVTTLNRQALLDETLAAIAKYSPDFPVVVVDDGSNPPAVTPNWVTLVRHDENLGIPRSKNRCIEELVGLGVRHLFLFDDDTHPASEDWWKPYVEGNEPHYQYNWTHFTGPRRAAVPRMEVVYQDSRLRAYGWSMGCMLYASAEVIDRVGGMHLGFGLGMEEHGEWSQRIHNAGLTSFVHQDVPGSSELFYAADENQGVTRSFSTSDRTNLLARNEALRIQRQDCDEFVEYRRTRDVVLSCYFTSQPDPQRGNVTWGEDLSVMAPLLDSLEAQRVSLVLLTDLPRTSGIGTVVETPLVAYRQRWLSQWQWLRDHPDTGRCWLVDATDVRMLNDPFPSMEPGTLYAGWEPTVVGCAWIRERSPKVIEWIDEHADETLLNCGVVGGDRATLMGLCQRMNDLWTTTGADPLHEMAFFNVAARRHPRLVTGPLVTTVFKSDTTVHPHSWWAHK